MALTRKERKVTPLQGKQMGVTRGEKMWKAEVTTVGGPVGITHKAQSTMRSSHIEVERLFPLGKLETMGGVSQQASTTNPKSVTISLSPKARAAPSREYTTTDVTRSLRSN
jgi:hypothetical protein